MTVLARPRARGAAADGRSRAERDQLGRIPRDLWEALAAADRPGSLVVPAHIYSYVLSRGVPAPDPVTGYLPVIRHRCDEPSCQTAVHLAAGSPGDNVQDYLARRRDPYSPLSDLRGPRGRAVAIRGAILAALAGDASLGEIEAAIEAASAAGIPGAQQVLF